MSTMKFKPANRYILKKMNNINYVYISQRNFLGFEAKKYDEVCWDVKSIVS